MVYPFICIGCLSINMCNVKKVAYNVCLKRTAKNFANAADESYNKKTPCFFGKAKERVYLCGIENILIMQQTSIISQENNAVTVRMSRRRWNHLLKLEESYKVAASIRKGMKQAEKAPALSVEESIELLRAL